MAATAATARGHRFGSTAHFPGLRRYVVPLGLLALWQASVGLGWISTRSIPSPGQILATFWELAASGELAMHLLVSLGRVSAGLAIGVSVGTLCALTAGLSRRGEDALDPLLQMLRTLPHLALVPLFILWFGIGETPKVALVALGTAFPIYLNLFAGIRTVDAKVVEAVSTLGLTRWELIAHVILPGALPAFLTGLRYALGVAWLSLVVGEQINASSGIGYLAMTAREFLRTDVIIVALIVYAVLGLAADQIVRLIERAALGWRPVFVKE
ncbi:ABC transporter permease subunit [Azospirillum picis]|nr:ABC transporter permease subunit [Azospirillum picis]